MTEMYRGTERGLQLPRDSRINDRALQHAQNPLSTEAQAGSKRTVQSQPELGYRSGNERRFSSVGEAGFAASGTRSSGFEGWSFSRSLASGCAGWPHASSLVGLNSRVAVSNIFPGADDVAVDGRDADVASASDINGSVSFEHNQKV